MNLNRPPEKYDPEDQRQMRDTLSSADNANIKKNTIQDKITMRSPNGSVWILTISNAGAPVVTAA